MRVIISDFKRIFIWLVIECWNVIIQFAFQFLIHFDEFAKTKNRIHQHTMARNHFIALENSRECNFGVVTLLQFMGDKILG